MSLLKLDNICMQWGSWGPIESIGGTVRYSQVAAYLVDPEPHIAFMVYQLRRHGKDTYGVSVYRASTESIVIAKDLPCIGHKDDINISDILPFVRSFDSEAFTRFDCTIRI